MDAGSFHDISEWSRKEKSADHYRATAERARKLLEEATTPRLKQYFGEVIAECERAKNSAQMDRWHPRGLLTVTRLAMLL